jgi:hypothetical protein
MDVCVATCCLEDIKCLDILLRSLGAFADLASCDLLVSHNSPNPHLHEMLTGVCQSHLSGSLNIDFFKPKETSRSQQHGEALNRLIARTTSKHVMVFDPDVIITSPRWLDFCKRHIDEGCFIVGTPYAPKLMWWQGDFPNVWCAMIDGDALRAAGLDMRPYRLERVADLGGPVDFQGLLSDTSWWMSEYALKNRLGYVSFSTTSKLLPKLLRQWSSNVPITLRRRVRNAAYRLFRLGALEFAFPGTNDVCCAHLSHVGGRPRRASGWTLCANMVLDACGTATVGRRGNLPDFAPWRAASPKPKGRPKMTRQQRRSRRRSRRIPVASGEEMVRSVFAAGRKLRPRMTRTQRRSRRR